MSYGHYWHFQCDSWCLPTQKRLKNATNDISIQEFHNIITHYKAHYYDRSQGILSKVTLISYQHPDE